MIASLSEYGRSFATRPRGTEIAAELAAGVRSRRDKELTVSFQGVSVISGSFADEFVSKLIARARVTRMAFEEMNPDVAARIRWAVEHSRRISESRGRANRLPELVT